LSSTLCKYACIWYRGAFGSNGYYAFDTGFVCYYRGWLELRPGDLQADEKGRSGGFTPPSGLEIIGVMAG
jgi:hypothetical protein